jgi:hypothetical protein
MMNKHVWENKGTMNGGPDIDGNDAPCTQWYCARCQTIAVTWGSYAGNIDPSEPKQVQGCDDQLVINIMQT